MYRNKTLGEREGSQRFGLDLYSEYYSKDRTPNNLVLNIKDFPKTWVFLGLMHQIVYKTDRFGKWEYFKHEFAKNYEPLMYADPYKRMLFLYGNLSITEQGIINMKDFPSQLNM